MQLLARIHQQVEDGNLVFWIGQVLRLARCASSKRTHVAEGGKSGSSVGIDIGPRFCTLVPGRVHRAQESGHSLRQRGATSVEVSRFVGILPEVV